MALTTIDMDNNMQLVGASVDDQFQAFTEGIFANNMESSRSDKLTTQDGLNLPGILLTKNLTKGGQMKALFVHLGSFDKIPECGDDPAKGNPRYKKVGNGCIHLKRISMTKIINKDGKYEKKGDELVDYVQLKEGQLLKLYTYTSMSSIPEFVPIWLGNLKVEYIVKPDSKYDPKNFFTAETVILCNADGGSIQRPVSSYQCKANFYHMMAADPRMETLINEGMMYDDAVMILVIRNVEELGKYFSDFCAKPTDHPQILKAEFRKAYVPRDGGQREERFLSYNRDTGESRKCIKFVMEGDRWNQRTETWAQAGAANTRTHIRLNMNAWSETLGVFSIIDPTLWSELGETILNASNFVVVSQVDSENTGKLQDNVDGTAKANKTWHMSVRVCCLALDYMDTLRKCGIPISARTAAVVSAHQQKPGAASTSTSSSQFVGKHAGDKDGLYQKPGESDIQCVSEMKGTASEIFNDERFEYRLVMPMSNMAELYGKTLKIMDPQIGDLFCSCKTKWNQTGPLKDADGKTIDLGSGEPLRRLVYDMQQVMSGAVFSISKNLRSSSETQNEMARHVQNVMENGVEYPNVIKKPSTNKIDAAQSATTPTTTTPANDDDVDLYGNHDETTPVQTTSASSASARFRQAGPRIEQLDDGDNPTLTKKRRASSPAPTSRSTKRNRS